MNPDQQNPNQPAVPPVPNSPAAYPSQQPLPQYPSPYPPPMSPGRQSWQQPVGSYATDTTPQLPQPQLPGQPQGQPLQQQPSVPAYANPTPGIPSYEVPSSGTPKKKAIFIAVATVIALVAVSLASYLVITSITKNGSPPEQAQTAQPDEKKPQTVALTSMSGVTLVPPTNLSRYTANTKNTELAMAYNTEGDACSLQLGVADEGTLPGRNAADIVARQIQALKDEGVTIDGPTEGDTLTLKDAGDGNKSYTLPTMIFTATDSAGKQVRSYYSAAVLKDGKRAYVSRTCQVASGKVGDASLQPLNSDAATITVRSAQ